MRVKTWVLVWLLSWFLADLCPAWAQKSLGTAPHIALIVNNTAGRDERQTQKIQGFQQALIRAGFSTIALPDLGRERMRETIDGFTSKLPRGSIALMFFHGRVARIGQRSVLLPVDAEASEGGVRADGIDLGAVEDDLSRHGVGVKVLIVDGTAADPAGERPGSATPPTLGVHDGTLAILNVAPARDADAGQSAIFLDELLKQLEPPGIPTEQAFARTRVAVAKATNGRQVPLIASSLLDDFYLLGAPGEAASGPAPGKPTADAAPARENAAPAPSRYRPGETFRDCASCPDLVVVPPGAFTMGSADNEVEKAPHRVTIAKPFAIGRHEVTFAHWDACAAAGACPAGIDDHGFGRGERPVIDVSWDEAQTFLKWLSAKAGQTYRLPSEAEWEYAARAGSGSAFAWGPAVGSGKANCADCGPAAVRATLPVGSFRPNAFGLFDTAGNAAEWVQDCWNGGYRGAPADGTPWLAGQCELRVLRGGSFGAKAAAVRVSARFRYDRDVRYYANGFRVVRDVMQP